MPATAGMAGMSVGLSARLVNRFGPRRVMYPGILTTAIGLILLGSAGPHASYFPQIFFALLLLGVGAGASFMPLLQIGMSEIPSADAGLGSGIVNVSQQMAAAVGLAVLSTVATNRSKSLVAESHAVVGALADGYQLAILIAAACVLVGLAVAPFLLRSSGSPEEDEEHIAEAMEDPESYEHLVL